MYDPPVEKLKEHFDASFIKKGKPSYANLSADHLMYPAADLMLLERMQNDGIAHEHMYKAAINAMLFRKSNIVLKGPNSLTWCAVKIDVDSVLLTTSLITHKTRSGRMLFELETTQATQMLRYECVFDATTYQGCLCTWESPVELFLKEKGKEPLLEWNTL